LGYPTADLYVETTTNASFPSSKTKDSIAGVLESGNGNGNGSSNGDSAIAAGAPFVSALLSVVGLLVALL